jgi:tripartite-type tricarboxylate transporter receptor subunit TctC
MMHSRRKCLQLAAAAVLPTITRLAQAQAYPARPVRIIVGFAAGGNSDIFARLFGQWLSERLGQPFIIENRPGAATNIATEMVVKSPSDGYTLLTVGPPNAINATLYGKLNFNFIRDVAPIAGIMRVPNIIVVNPSFPAKTVPEFIAYAKANPGKLNIATAGIGTSQHINGELFKTTTGIDLVTVHYRGAPLALTDLIGGQVQVTFDPLPSSIEHVRAGKLRALAVTTATRAGALPDIPSLSEFLPGYEASGLFGIGAPKGVSTEITDRLNKEINAAFADLRMRSRLADLGGTVVPGSPADFGKLIADETEKWGQGDQGGQHQGGVGGTAGEKTALYCIENGMRPGNCLLRRGAAIDHGPGTHDDVANVAAGAFCRAWELRNTPPRRHSDS